MKMARTEDSDDILSALKHLAQLQHRLTELRTLLPATIAPLTTASLQPTPESLYARFAASASEATYSIRNFRAAWEDDETKRVLKQVQESLATGGDNVVSRRWWDDGLDEDLNVKAEEMDQKMHGFVIRDGQLPDGNDSNTGMTGSESSISAVLETFRGRGPGFSVDEVGNEHYHVAVQAGTRRLDFSVQRTETALGSSYFRVMCNGPTAVHNSITRCLDSRPHTGRLEMTLNMLGAYFDFASTQARCGSCNKLVDASAMPPTARRRNSVKAEDGGTIENWDAYHEGCL